MRPPLSRVQEMSQNIRRRGRAFMSKDEDHPRLRIWILVTAAFHLIQGFIVLGTMYPKNTDFPIVKTYASWNRNYTAGANGTRIVYASEPFGSLRLSSLLLAFFFLSALFQGVPALFWWDHMKRLLAEGMQPFRWFEYAFSASCMLWVAATLAGINDFYFLLVLFASNAVLMLLGLLQEQRMYMWRNMPDNENLLSVSPFAFAFPHILGWLIFLTTWSVLFDKLRLSVKHNPVPDMVFAFYVVLFLLFASFAAVQIAQAAIFRDRRISEERVKSVSLACEFAYTLLSLVAKTLIAWLYYGGVMAYANL